MRPTKDLSHPRRPPQRPAGYENIETLPQRFEVMDADVDHVKGYIARHAG